MVTTHKDGYQVLREESYSGSLKDCVEQKRPADLGDSPGCFLRDKDTSVLFKLLCFRVSLPQQFVLPLSHRAGKGETRAEWSLPEFSLGERGSRVTDHSHVTDSIASHAAA